jgi:glycosyltransferase involved in cell wall biosynthesis
VITPAYNAEAFIARTLRTVEEQTYGDWEAVVADDASEDGTAAAVEAIGNPRIRVVRNPANTGPAGARNLALQHARGELVALLDADDAWRPRFLERMVAEYDGTGAQIVTCDAILVRDGEELTGTYRGRIAAPASVTLENLLEENSVLSASLIERRAGEAVGWFDPAMFGTEDHDLWLRILEDGGRVAIVDEPLVVYRLGDTSLSSDLGRMAQNEQKVLRSALERGRLTQSQRRIARARLDYHRAMEVVAERTGVVRNLPLLARVVATNPSRWGSWVRALRHGDRAY